MKSFRVKNLRSVADSGVVELRPITIIVGKNSSGKSTLTRVLPLLKQSVEVSTSGPILWYGDYVDFGSIETALRKSGVEGDSASHVSFEFNVDLPPKRGSSSDPGIERHPTAVSASIKVSRRPGDQRESYLSEFCYLVDGVRVRVSLDAVGNVLDFEVDGDSLSRRLSTETWRIAPSVLLPTRFVRGNEESLSPIYLTTEHLVQVARPFGVHTFYHSRFRRDNELVRAAVGVLFRSDFSEYGHFGLYSILDYFDADVIDEASLRQWIVKKPHKQRKKMGLRESIEKNPADLRVAAGLLAAIRALSSVAEMESSLAKTLEDSAYTGPLRVNPSRFYRRQEVSVQEIDHRGHNFPMFLRSLSDLEMHDLSEYARRSFGVNVERRASGEQIEVLVSDGGPMVNLVDAGFGFSQLLPFVAQIWNISRKGKGPLRRRMQVLEQPELHLHPAHQAKISDMLAGVVRESNKAGASIRFVVETHSEAIVNRLGELIANKVLRAEDAQVLVMGSETNPGDNGAFDVRRADFDENGVLRHWPFGFFNP
jgi:hypothetical protein